jgi:hypothetical protein
MLIENCKNLIYKRGPIVLACCTSFALGSLGTATLIHTTAAAADSHRAAATVRQVSFLPGLGSLPNAVKHVRVHVQAHVRAVRRKHDPKPRTRSSATISLYESTTAPGVFRDQGCSAAKRGATGVIILDFGKPSYNGHTYGTILFSGAFAGNTEITHAMAAYATGYVRCLPRGSADHIDLARGTSNYHPTVPSVYKAGRKWARETMALARSLRLHGLHVHVRAAAADDVEPAWDRSFHRTRDFFRGFRDARTGHLLYHFGSLDGGVGGIWNARQAFFVAGGMRYARAIPEIYNHAMARQWAELAHIARHRYHRPVQFAGVMTTHTSRNRGMQPRDAHKTLVRALARRIGTSAPDVPPTLTNIRAAQY